MEGMIEYVTKAAAAAAAANRGVSSLMMLSGNLKGLSAKVPGDAMQTTNLFAGSQDACRM